jgi:hypothetical protein
MAREKTLQDVINRLVAEGQLTRNTGSHSIRTVKEVLKSTHEESANQMDDLKDAIMHSTESTLQASKNIFDSIVNPTTENESPDTAGDIEEKEREQNQLFKSLLDAQLENNKLTRDILFLQKGMKGGGSGSRFGFTRLGNIFGGSALTALLAPAAAMASIGAGVGGFFLGLKASNLALEFFDSEPNYDGIKKAVVAFGDIFKDVDASALTATLAVLTGGAVAGVLFGPVKGAGGLASGMTAIGAGISGFFLGLATGDKALSWLNTDMTALKSTVVGLADVLSVLSESDGFILTGALMAAGGALGMLFGVGRTGRAAAGLTLIGAGIAGFMVEMAAVSAIAEQFGTNGEGLKSLMENVAGGLTALGSIPASVVATLLGAAGLFGAAPAIGGKATVGLGLVGLGLGTFFAGFGIADKFTQLIGATGENMKQIMVNMSTGLSALADVDGVGLMKTAGGILAMGPALLALLGQEGLLSIRNALGGVVDFIFGDDDEKSLFEKVADSLKAFEDVDGTNLKNIADAVTPLVEYAAALEYFENMDVDKIIEKLNELGTKMGDINKLMITMYEGGEITDGAFEGVKVEVGLKDVPTEEIEESLRPLAMLVQLDTSEVDSKLAEIRGRNLEIPASVLTQAAQVAEETRATPRPVEEVVVTAEREPPPRREDFLPVEPPPTFLPRVENPYEGLEVPTPKFEMEPLEAPELDIPDIQIEPPAMSERELGSMYLQDQQKQLASQTTNTQVASIAMMGGSTNISNNSNSQTTNLIGSRPSSRNGSRASNWRVG